MVTIQAGEAIDRLHGAAAIGEQSPQRADEVRARQAGSDPQLLVGGEDRQALLGMDEHTERQDRKQEYPVAVATPDQHVTARSVLMSLDGSSSDFRA